MEEKQLICINCPMGCHLTVQWEEGRVLSVSGNTCPRGAAYAESELLHPVRVLTTTVRIDDGNGYHMLPVKSAAPLPKEHLMEYMAVINALHPVPPLHVGDVLLENIGDTGVNIVATGNWE